MKRALHLIVVLLILAGLALGAFQLAQRSWDQVAEYQSPFTGALPSGKEGQQLVALRALTACIRRVQSS